MKHTAIRLTLVLTLGLLAMPLSTRAQNADALLHPRPEYSPDAVVRIQLEALADNDTPHKDAGIAVAFRFASPANKIVTGPLDRFIHMVHNPMYSPMLHHQAARYGELRLQGNLAMQSVILTTSDGTHVGYVFFLSRQTGAPCEGCWMTDSVLRFEVESA